MTRLRARGIFFALLIALSFCLKPSETRAAERKPIRVLVIYGGHDFETNQFLNVFKGNPEITLQTAVQPKAQEFFKPEAARGYDVLVFYDMWPKMSDEAKADLIARLKEGKGLVALHHCLGGFQTWAEYKHIIGGQYHLEKWTENGAQKPASTYKHDVDFTVHVADPNHPVTRGVKDFAIHDETYGGFEVLPQAHILLTTDEPTNGHNIAWTKTYGAARVVYLQLGHDHQAYENPNYQQLLRQAIRWVAKRNNAPDQ